MYLKCLTFLFKLAAHNCEYLKNFASTSRSLFLLILNARTLRISGSILLITYSLTIASAKEDDGERWNSLASYLGQIIFPSEVRAERSVHKFLQLKHALYMHMLISHSLQFLIPVKILSRCTMETRIASFNISKPLNETPIIIRSI